MIIKKIEKKRLKKWNKSEQDAIKNITFIRGDFIRLWYLNREREKGNIKYQVTKGLCMAVRYKEYNSSFVLRSNIRNIVFEQLFNYSSLTNINIESKINTIREYIKNVLWYLKTKKNRQSRVF